MDSKKIYETINEILTVLEQNFKYSYGKKITYDDIFEMMKDLYALFTNFEKNVKACGELAKRVGIKMNFESQGLDRDYYMSQVEKLSYLAYEDQCSPANPRVPMVEDMQKILRDAYDNKEFLD